jgi:hypothetical protein
MKRTAVIGIALLASLALSGCSAGGAFDSAGNDGAYYSESDGAAPDAGAPQFEGSLDAGGGEGDVKSTSDQLFITTGTMDITADKPLEAAARATEIVEDAGGRIDARSENAPVDGNKGSATLELRIPTDSLTPTLAKLRALGVVESLDTDSEDVTSQSKDLDARIVAMRASVDRLVVMLAKSNDTATLLEIEQTLSNRQGELESLESQKRSLGDQTQLATIVLTLDSVPPPPVVKEPEVPTFLTGLAAGWGAFTAFINGLVVVFGALLPWLIFLALIGGAVLLLIRWRRSKKAAAVSAP